jgi:hypothetical protein
MQPHTCTATEDCFGCKVKTLQFQATPAFQPHYNWSVGKYVETESHFNDELKRCGERNSVATGLDHDYQPRYVGDREVGDIEATRKTIHDRAVEARVKDPVKCL